MYDGQLEALAEGYFLREDHDVAVESHAYSPEAGYGDRIYNVEEYACFQ